MTRSTYAGLVAALTLLATACQTHPQTRTDETMHQAIANGVSSLPAAADFHKLYPASESFISYYTGQVSAPVWNSKVGLLGRYVLTMQVDIDIDPAGTAVTAKGEPRYDLVEVKSISKLPDGRADIAFDPAADRKFGPDGWKKLAAAGGDLASLGIQVKANQPVPNFDESWKLK